MPTRSADTQLIKMLRDEGVLVDAEGHRLDSPNGVILISCSDGDQMVDIFHHTIHMLAKGGGKIRPHTFAYHGGGMLLDHDCPLCRKRPYDEIFMEGIADARAMKDIDTVALLVHAPCGAARMANLNVVQVLHHVVQAKMRIKSRWPDLKVGCFFHVDYPPCNDHANGRKRTYFLSKVAFDQWFKHHGSEFLVRKAPDCLNDQEFGRSPDLANTGT